MQFYSDPRLGVNTDQSNSRDGKKSGSRSVSAPVSAFFDHDTDTDRESSLLLQLIELKCTENETSIGLDSSNFQELGQTIEWTEEMNMINKTFLPAFLIVMFAVLAMSAGVSQEPTQPAQPTQQAQPAQPAQPPQEILPGAEVVVPEGTVIPIVLTEYLNTQSSQAGDIVYADTTYPVWIQQRLVIPKGSTIRGTLTDVVRPGKIKGKGRIAVRFDDILLPNGVRRELVATFRGMHGPGDETLDRKSESVKGGSNKGDDVGTVVGTTSTGAIIGALIGHGKGAAIGAGAGAAGGIATLLFSRGRDLVLNPGTRFDLELLKPMKFAYNETQFSRIQIDEADRSVREVRQAPADTNRTRRPLGGIGGPSISPFPRY